MAHRVDDGVTTLVLAGGAPDAVAALVPGVANKAFVPIAGRCLVARTIDALRTVPNIDRVIVVSPPSTEGHPALARADERRDSGERIADSLRVGVADLDENDLVLVAASDLPILSRAAVEAFLRDARLAGGDIAYSCVERRVHEARFPDVPHTWARLREGQYCGGGLIGLRPRAFPSLARFLDRLGAARKHPLRLASIFGYDTLLRYVVGSLRIADAERRASMLVERPVRAIPSMHPEIAVNVDRPGDVALAEQLVATANA